MDGRMLLYYKVSFIFVDVRIFFPKYVTPQYVVEWTTNFMGNFIV